MGTLTRWANFLVIVLFKKKKRRNLVVLGKRVKMWMNQAWSQNQNYQSWDGDWRLDTVLAWGMLCIFQ